MLTKLRIVERAHQDARSRRSTRPVKTTTRSSRRHSRRSMFNLSKPLRRSTCSSLMETSFTSLLQRVKLPSSNFSRNFALRIWIMANTAHHSSRRRTIQHLCHLRKRRRQGTHRTRPWYPQPTRSRLPRLPPKASRELPIDAKGRGWRQEGRGE